MKSKPRAARHASPLSHGPRANGSARSPHSGEQKPRPGSGSADAGPGTAKGPKIWLYGFHPVLAAIANPNRKCLRLLMTSDAEASLGARVEQLARTHPAGGPAPEIVDRAAIERTVPRGAVHQGIAAQFVGLDEPDIEDICRALDGHDTGRVVVLDQVTDPHNVGAILRSAAAFGAAAVVLQERNSPGQTGVLAKSASGALETVPLVRVVNLARALESLKKAGFWCVGLDAAAATPLNEADLSGKVALVLGAEGEGLRRLTREHCDLMVRVPLARGIDSLNVSNAAAIALYELARRSS